jgi:iron complex transport system permease protein
MALGLAAALASIGAACLLGPYPVPAGEAVSALLSSAGLADAPADPAVSVVVLDIRAGRACLAFLAGASLAVAGAVYQAVLQNPLADPYTLGVASGAALGASLAISLGLTGIALLPGMTGLPVFGLAGAVAALALVLLLGRAAGGARREGLVLAGVVTATFLAALISLVKALDEESVASIVFWIMGSLQGRGWSHAGLVAPFALLGAAVAGLRHRELDLLSLGATQAEQLGASARRTRLLLLGAASLATGAAVAVCGIIGFVGLVAPHLVRLVLGAEHGPLLAGSGLLGGILLVWADVLARMVLPGGAELPVGVVTALIGGPFFCLLLVRRLPGGRS